MAFNKSNLPGLSLKGGLIAGALLLLVVAIATVFVRPSVVLDTYNVAVTRAHGASTVESRLDEFQEGASDRLRPYFDKADVVYPPAKVVMVGLKKEKELQLYAADSGEELAFIRAYPILAASGALGPKLRQGDRQVPEGLYTIDALNPNSRFHLSLHINYPNEFDLRQAALEGRDDPGDNIFVHGDAVSIGCLAMGDEVAEELFVLAALTGVDDVDIILSPVDFRTTEVPAGPRAGLPPWIEEVYAEIRTALSRLPSPE
ncbi:MAG: L,D-transpeptidase family protein [Bradymonadaceae bacterium]